MKRKRNAESSSVIVRPDATGESSSEEYDVFLNFRGVDTRYGFIDCLYEFLTGAGMRVFMDDEVLRIGEDIGDELLTAIDCSRIYVPVFSRNYASSKWCLIELARMVKRARRSDRKEILPVFFEVEPVDVKLKTDMYTEDLLRLEERHGRDMVRKWRKALRKIPRSKGWNLRSNQGQGKLIREIAERISRLLELKHRILPDHYIGMEKQVQDVMYALDTGSNDVRIVVIHGMGGIGKTTLASVIFNKICGRFQGCSFLSNVRETAAGNGMISLQNRLLRDMLRFSSQDSGDANAVVKRIRSSLRNRDVLIVLDDVSEMDQIRKLIGMGSWVGLGSRVVITTRNLHCIASGKEIGNNIRILQGKMVYIYRMRELDFDNALRLFCRNAFGIDTPRRGYELLSRDMLSFAGGVPLALEVVGSHLRGKGVAIWKEALKRFEKEPHDRLYRDILMLSYEMLCDGMKEIFLDIAFFLADHDKTTASYYWEACGHYPETSIETLTSYALIKTDSSNRLQMHDLLRDLGREVVHKQSVDRLEMRSRLCNEDAKRFLQRRKVNLDVNAMKLDSAHSHDFTPAELSRLSDLMFLELDGGNFTGKSEGRCCLSELRWFSWQNCAMNFGENNFDFENLVVLRLSGSNITGTWAGWEQFQTAGKLKVLEIEGPNLKSTPNLSAFSCLEKLTIRTSRGHFCIDPSISDLRLLNSLELVSDRNMLADVFHLPSSICKSKALSRLVIKGLNLKRLPENIGDLEALEILDITWCPYLRNLPDSIGDMGSLRELRLCQNAITELPESIGKLGGLTKLDVSYNHLRTLPAAMGDLLRLEELNISRNDRFEGFIPRELGKLLSLRSLNLSYTYVCQLPSWALRIESLQLGDCFLGILQAS